MLFTNQKLFKLIVVLGQGFYIQRIMDSFVQVAVIVESVEAVKLSIRCGKSRFICLLRTAHTGHTHIHTHTNVPKHSILMSEWYLPTDHCVSVYVCVLCFPPTTQNDVSVLVCVAGCF